MGSYWNNALNHGFFAVEALLGAILAGTVLTPILLPFLPGRAFSLKGFWLGMMAAGILIAIRGSEIDTKISFLEILAWLFLIPAIAAYLAMNFTGCSTYTSLSGVKKEMRFALPLEIAAGVIGLVLWIGSRFFS